MSTQLQIQTKAAPQPSFTPVQAKLLQRKCACGQHTIAGSECSDCHQKREGMMQRAATSPTSMTTVPPIVHDVLASSGRPLDAGTRAFMEPCFRHDFSQVQVHADGQAAESARTVNALAYTVGRDIVFGSGQYAPGTSEGKRLLAHELTHVVQQSKNLSNPTTVIYPAGNIGEEEADHIASKIMQDNSTSLQAQQSDRSLTPENRTLNSSTVHPPTSLRVQNVIQRQTMSRGPGCDDLLVQIIARLVELKERAKAIMENPLNLPLTGPMSVGGHQQQFQDKQVNLRRILNQWNTDNCGPGLPADAWQWATRPVPVSPSSPRVAEPLRDGSRITGEDVAKGAAVGAGVVVGGYIIYRVVRFLPSLLPPLWWTIPPNLAIP